MARFTSSSFSFSSAAGSSSGAVDDAFEDACSICLEPFSTDDPATVTSCKHEYHLQCILEWSQRSKECPICWQQFVLKDPASQELLAAIDSERRSKLRNIPTVVPVTFTEDFDTELDAHLDYNDMEARVMQHVATARYFCRRGMPRYHGFDASQVFDTTSAYTPGALPTNLPSPDLSHGSSEGDLPTSDMRSVVNGRPPSSDPGDAVNGDGPFKSRVFFRQSPPDSPRRPNPFEIFSFSESVKSKWSAASARYKESISKSTRSLKERLLARNNSVKELSKEVQREMSAGIAGVAKMIERLDLASKQSGTSIPVSGNAAGTSSDLFKGKGVQESVVNKRTAEVAPRLSSDAPSYVADTNSGQLEVSHQSGL